VEGKQIHWDDHTLKFVFETPLTAEQRQDLAELTARHLGLTFKDSFEGYSLAGDSDTEGTYLYGCEVFEFIDTQ
jgi:hypothetical protein